MNPYVQMTRQRDDSFLPVRAASVSIVLVMSCKALGTWTESISVFGKHTQVGVIFHAVTEDHDSNDSMPNSYSDS